VKVTRRKQWRTLQVARTPSRHSASAILGEGQMNFNNFNLISEMEFGEIQLNMAPQASNKQTNKKIIINSNQEGT